MTSPFAGLGSGFQTIVCDPPWRFAVRSGKGEGKSPQAHYSCMSMDAIKALPVAELAARDCMLLLWTSAPLLAPAMGLLDHWGFAYKSRFGWRKMTKNQKVRMGPGYLVRTMHEDVLIATRGQPKLAAAFPSLFDGLAREHSRKPDQFYAMVEARAPAPRLDLFARQSRPGWTVWGNEAGKFDEPAEDAA